MARKILLADDSVTAQNMGRKILADAGYEVITVNNGSAALKKIGDQRPDLIVLDVYMPGYSGLEVCQRLKEAGDTARIPILLTVGKLEPFKPEEAKRVHADAFIVKPFEASELLSALSKLEDKVVPRSESSKPGRFARATAALDESRYDKSMAVEEDSGWKNRISFPSKKKKEKEKEEEVNADDPAIYNAVNKDLRTVVEHKPAEHPHPEQGEDHVNVGALASEGLPKDVTPEEIAALAAAAAQIKGKFEDEKIPEPIAELPVNAPVEVESAKPEIKEETRTVEPVPVPEPAASEPPATFAEQKAEEKKDEEKVESKEAVPEVTATQAEVSAAIAGLEKEASAAPARSSASESWRPASAEKADEPVTMAVAAGAETAPLTPRWVAQAVALAPEEASISLEQEMQKAYAAFAAAEGGHTVTVAPIQETQSVSVPAAETPAPAETAVVEPPAEIPATPAPEAVQPLTAVAEAAADAVSAAVKELESVAATYEAETSRGPVAEEPPAAVAPEPSTMVASEPEPAVVPTPEPAVVSELTPAISEVQQVETKTEEPAISEPVPEPEAITKAKVIEAEEPETKSSEADFEEKTVESKEAALVAEASAAVAEVVEAETSKAEEVSAEPPAAVPNVRIAGGTDEMAKRESETAAAWASWRKISVDKTPADSSEESPKDSAAMAVAAGSESSPEDVKPIEETEEIASIVDSVLADMRPKIVEEIAKKLGKKK